MTFLKIYLMGVLVCFLISLLFEHLYFGNGRSETVHGTTILENFIYSLLSWLGVLGELVFFAGEWVCGFDQKGQGEFLHDYEEMLKRGQSREHTRHGASRRP